MGTYNFQDDLAVAKKCEERVGKWLASIGATDIEYNNDKRWDIRFKLKDEYLTLEVKDDQMASKTGNVAFETKSRGKESGITTSEADYWLYVLGEKLYLCKTVKLRIGLMQEGFRQVIGGDNGTSRLVLVPLEQFKKIFKRVK